MAWLIVSPDHLGQGVGADGRTTGDCEPAQQPARLSAAQTSEINSLDGEPAEQPHPHDHPTGIPHYFGRPGRSLR